MMGTLEVSFNNLHIEPEEITETTEDDGASSSTWNSQSHPSSFDRSNASLNSSFSNAATDDIEHKIKYVNYYLANLKISGLSERVLKFDSMDDDSEKFNIVDTAILLIKGIAELQESRDFLLSDIEELEKMHQRDTEQRVFIERELVKERTHLKELNRKLLLTRKRADEVSVQLSKSQEDLKLQTASNQQKSVQYQHELRKKERECSRLQDRLQQHLSHVYSSKKIGVRNISKCQLSADKSRTGPRPQRSLSTAASQQQANAALMETTCQEYEERIHELCLENQMLKKAFLKFSSSVSSLAETSNEAANINSAQFYMPFHVVKPAIEQANDRAIGALTKVLDRISSQVNDSFESDSLAMKSDSKTDSLAVKAGSKTKDFEPRKSFQNSVLLASNTPKIKSVAPQEYDTPIHSILRRTPQSSNPSTASKSISFAQEADVYVNQLSSSASSSFSISNYSIEHDESNASKPSILSAPSELKHFLDNAETESEDSTVGSPNDISSIPSRDSSPDSTVDSSLALFLRSRIPELQVEDAVKQFPIYSSLET